VLVHGGWADGSSWDKVVPLLLAKGYDVVAVHNPLSSLADDVATVKRVITPSRATSCWSATRMAGSSSRKRHRRQGQGLVYVAAFGLDVNEIHNRPR